jgi:hypothetical protein
MFYKPEISKGKLKRTSLFLSSVAMIKQDFTKQHTSSGHSNNKIIGSYGKTLLLINELMRFPMTTLIRGMNYST